MTRQATWRPRAMATLLAVLACFACVRCGGNSSTGTPSPAQPTPTPVTPPGPTTPVPPAAPHVFVGAGDIGWNDKSGGQEQTARLIDGIGGDVFTAGDNAYLDGSAQNYRDWYNPSWGRFLGRTHPVPGNHEYDTDHSMAGYFGYFGAAFARPQGLEYYSFPLGDWHVIALNSTVPANAAAGSAQGRWLQADLAANTSKCTIAYWHHPLFTSGQNGPNSYMRDVWTILYAAGVDVVINGHDHLYERFAPQAPDGRPDSARGIREFIVGTGGAQFYRFVTTSPNSERQIANTYGVLKFTLSSGTYDWQFIPVSGVSDSGSGTCHVRPAALGAPAQYVTGPRG